MYVCVYIHKYMCESMFYLYIYISMHMYTYINVFVFVGVLPMHENSPTCFDAHIFTHSHVSMHIHTYPYWYV